MAEAIDHVRELGHDRRIEGRVVDLRRRKEDIDLRLDLARELLEHEVLILHLGAEAGRLEEALAVPEEGGDVCLGVVGIAPTIGQQPFIQECDIVRCECDILDVFDQPVVLGVEDVVDRSETDVFVAAAVAGDEVASSSSSS